MEYVSFNAGIPGSGSDADENDCVHVCSGLTQTMDDSLGNLQAVIYIVEI